MKSIQIYISLFFICGITCIGTTYASSDKGESTRGGSTHTQHPPHDHHEPDHIKKLDEGMRRRRKDEK